MTRRLAIERCTACGLAAFPARLACPACGGWAWEPAVAEAGVVEQITVVRHIAGGERAAPRRIASVRADCGPMLVAGVADDVRPGARVRLRHDGPVLRAGPEGQPPSEEV